MSEKLRVTIEGGKYTVVQTEIGGLVALRYGEDWRDLTGDNLVFCLACRVDELDKDKTALKAELRQQAKANDDNATELKQRIAEAEADNAALRKDAERYRWLRRQGWIDDNIMEVEGFKADTGDELDRVIDSRMGKVNG